MVQSINNLVLMSHWRIGGMYAMSLYFMELNSYYVFVKECNQSGTRGWDVRLMLFNKARRLLVNIYCKGIV